jgi:hypothetical protein
MSSILDSIQQQVSASAVQNVSQRLGVDPVLAQQAVNAAIPIITAALAAHAKSGGAETVHREVAKQAEGAPQANPLPQILGRQHDTIEQRVSDATGISREDAGKLLGAVAPAVMRGIGQHVRQQGLDPAQLGSALAGAATGTQQSGRDSTASGEARL